MIMMMILHVLGFVKKKKENYKKEALKKKRYGDTYLYIAKHLVSNSYFLHGDSTTALHLSWNRLQKPF